MVAEKVSVTVKRHQVNVRAAVCSSYCDAYWAGIAAAEDVVSGVMSGHRISAAGQQGRLARDSSVRQRESIHADPGAGQQRGISGGRSAAAARSDPAIHVARLAVRDTA